MLQTRTGAKDIALLLHADEAHLALDDRQLLSLDEAIGARLTATRGTLWVTQDGDGADHILQAGESLVVRQAGRTLVMALGGPAAFIARESARPGWSVLWRNVMARLVHGALERMRPRRRIWVHE